LRRYRQHVGVREPALYRHFAGKEEIYTQVLERALRPIAGTLDALAAGDPTPQQLDELPTMMIDMLAKHPNVAALFQQALHSRHSVLDHELMAVWLQNLLIRGQTLVGSAGFNELDETESTPRLINLFNICTGYFAAAKLVEQLSGADPLSSPVLERQKSLVTNIVRAWMIS